MHRSLETTLGSLRSLFGILMGLTFANGVRNYITAQPGSEGVVLAGDVWVPEFALAVLFFFMVIQFYHYNLRLLEGVTGPRTRRNDVADPARRSRYANLWIEYFFPLVQAALFGAASWYIYHPSEFLMMMTLALGLNLLLFVRKIWWFAIELWPRLGLLADSIGPFRRGAGLRDPGEVSVARRQFRSMDWFRQRYRWSRDTRWFIINAVAVLFLIFILALPSGELADFGWRYWTVVSTLGLRVVVDYAVNWSHYFPSGPTAMNIFLAAPELGFRARDGATQEPGYQVAVRSLAYLLERRGHDVRTSHEVAAWQRPEARPDEFVSRDYANVAGCDVVCAIVTEHPSDSLYIELGWAFGLRKDVLLLSPLDADEVNVRALDHAGLVLKYPSLTNLSRIIDEVEDGLAFCVEEEHMTQRSPLPRPLDVPDIYISSRTSFSALEAALLDSPFSTFAARRLNLEGESPWLWRSFYVMEQCELIIIDIDESTSGHSEIDLGYALAVHKPIIALYPSGYEASPLVAGLGGLYADAENPLSGQRPHVHLIAFEDAEDKVRKAMDALDHFSSIAEVHGLDRAQV